MKILLIDDDAFSLRLLSIQLRGSGLSGRGYGEVICCSSAEEACTRLAEDGGIALIFCDLQMPGMDGVEFIRYLERARFAGGLVLISGEPQRTRLAVEQLAKAHRLNVLGGITKPVNREALQELLDLAVPALRPEEPAEPAGHYSREELLLAIERGELVNHYQPKVELRTGRVVGVEALVRWQHPGQGLVPPGSFVSLCEEHGLMQPLAMTVLRAALRDLRHLHDRGHALDVAVNISLSNVSALDFPDVLAAEAEVAGVPLSQLVLEVTETRIMDDPQAQLDVLIRLRLRQVRLSIDDFGTGYSCLAQLRDLPFDELKIDRSFVHGASGDASLRAMVETSLALARDLGIQVVAEGVEERSDWDLLRELGCDLAQGFLVAKPMPVERIAPWIEEWTATRSPELVG